LAALKDREEQMMDSVTSGTFVGAGSFRCERCGYMLTLAGSDLLSACPGCGSTSFARASLFGTERILPDRAGAELLRPAPADQEEHLEQARSEIDRPGDYLCYEEGDHVHTVALTREWTRIGRSLAADVRFDDPTVSRRHALIVRQPDGVRLLDDRSLNGVFVNGSRVDGKTLKDGDEIIVGRYRLLFVSMHDDADRGTGVIGSPTATHTLA
jgi:pSer/pThr/pTyr-binding forkhead associated (FHA) protein